MASDDTEITMGAGKLLGLFFMLVAVCGVFFAIGYSLGKTSVKEQALNDKAAVNASLGSPAVTESNFEKPSAEVKKTEPLAEEPIAKNPQPDLTFYKAVKHDATQPAADTAEAKAVPAKPSAGLAAPEDSTHPKTQAAPSVIAKADPKPPTTVADGKPIATSPNGAFVVQIAAVNREEDAAALAGALRKKSYSVFVVGNPAKDKFFHVQVGPFATLQDAEAMKIKLTGEGYNPIIKKS